MNHVFHQMELDEELPQFFVFTNPFGLYKFKRLIQGISLVSAECNEAFRRILVGIEGVAQIKDNLVIYGCGKQHNDRMNQVLECGKDYNITFLNKSVI